MPHAQPSRTITSRGFTLVEMLVVVFVLLVLVAILSPVIASAKARAEQASCLSKLKTLGYAIQLYAEDYDDLSPRAMSFPYLGAASQLSETQADELPLLPTLGTALHGYLNGTDSLRCPSDTGAEVVDLDWPAPVSAPTSLFGATGSSFMYRVSVGIAGVPMSSLENVGSLSLLMDGAGNWHGTGPSALASDDAGSLTAMARKFRYNALFIDGSVQNLGFIRAQAEWNQR